MKPGDKVTHSITLEKQMSALAGLKLVSAKRPVALAPIQIRRNKVVVNLSEQIALAKSLKDGTKFTPTRIRNVKNGDTGEVRQMEATKRVRPWFFTADSGKVVVQLRYGSKVIDVAKGKNSIEVNDGSHLITVLETLKVAVETGELDQQMSVAADAVKARFAK
jgi:hypothetical protein